MGDSLPGFDKLMWQTNLLKLFLTLTAVISGAEGWEEIEDFGRLRLEWLKSTVISVTAYRYMHYCRTCLSYRPASIPSAVYSVDAGD